MIWGLIFDRDRDFSFLSVVQTGLESRAFSHPIDTRGFSLEVNPPESDSNL
jgi:hypothetical protein